jgi:hypothetical protein
MFFLSLLRSGFLMSFSTFSRASIIKASIPISSISPLLYHRKKCLYKKLIEKKLQCQQMFIRKKIKHFLHVFMYSNNDHSEKTGYWLGNRHTFSWSPAGYSSTSLHQGCPSWKSL